MPCTMQVFTNSRRPAFCWKWTKRSVLLLLLLSVNYFRRGWLYALPVQLSVNYFSRGWLYALPVQLSVNYFSRGWLHALPILYSVNYFSRGWLHALPVRLSVNCFRRGWLHALPVLYSVNFPSRTHIMFSCYHRWFVKLCIHFIYFNSRHKYKC